MNAKLHTYNNKVSVHNYVAMYLQQLPCTKSSYTILLQSTQTAKIQ